MTTRNRDITELVARTFAVAESDARIEAARRNVDMAEVNLEQWQRYFEQGYYAKARDFWFNEVEKGN